ncbi:hypothetical protein HBI56_086710 [Parastagonospora nodorum]|uniref:Uncharacterized protein n=1 Tax=Phaeosphaeria nodorum (strain SN15 / ATCC MYA-4574 / FGSC 10173) TaxID=321614 RepID=A0A7U2FFY8_PHANO|nr:hypothetical protein HBH56_112880 [Parastagonospora nodorum]QRD03534.1 hypothetical protein JI435_419690 [Parastagonospora nodorum SN15]KAH3921507.1 hypothetical protein HBH54_239590 [Parastagonospora nodorum]KAH3951023.1 hypothetical protein HBH53_068540 [Parastagonospora nodorum]KAH3963028.1 hypothetical protein HBH51_169210 [Parastagonospora nodorum]
MRFFESFDLIRAATNCRNSCALCMDSIHYRRVWKLSSSGSHMAFQMDSHSTQSSSKPTRAADEIRLAEQPCM